MSLILLCEIDNYLPFRTCLLRNNLIPNYLFLMMFLHQGGFSPDLKWFSLYSDASAGKSGATEHRLLPIPVRPPRQWLARDEAKGRPKVAEMASRLSATFAIFGAGIATFSPFDLQAASYGYGGVPNEGDSVGGHIAAKPP